MCFCDMQRISTSKDELKTAMASEAQNGELYAVRINYDGYNAPPLLDPPCQRRCNASTTASCSSKLSQSAAMTRNLLSPQLD